MTHATTTETQMTIGIDLGDRYSHFCVLDDGAEVLEDGRLRTTPRAFQQRFGSIPRPVRNLDRTAAAGLTSPPNRADDQA